jgi:hypothetical protein
MRIEDRLFGEVDDSCANCGARDRQILTVHHLDRDPSNNTYDNQIVLCHNCHTRHHQEKGLSADQIRDRKRHLIAKTVTTFGINAMKVAERNGGGVIAMPFLLLHLVDLNYMRQEEIQMTYGDIEATARFPITEEGRRILRKWFYRPEHRPP